MAQLAQGLGLDLADALTRHLEVAADLFEGMILAIHQAEAQLQDLALTLGKRGQGMLDLLTQHLTRGRIQWLEGVHILDEIFQLAGILVTAGGPSSETGSSRSARYGPP